VGAFVGTRAGAEFGGDGAGVCLGVAGAAGAFGRVRSWVLLRGWSGIGYFR
jgi:hypothetical protein